MKDLVSVKNDARWGKSRSRKPLKDVLSEKELVRESKVMKASELAKQLIENAKQNEPIITDDVLRIALLTELKVIGRENKFKSEKSLVRKLIDKSTFTRIPLPKVAKRINDTLRYTYLVSENNYAAALESVQYHFEKSGYVISKIFNAWELEQTPEDSGYRGVNITVISSQKQKFELQLHTEASFALKTETHGLYDEFRNPNTSETRKAEISDIVKEKAKTLKRPKGI